MSGSTDGPITLMLLPLDCRVKVLSLIDCPKAAMRLCQACRTFGYRLPANERARGMICEATKLWQAVLARKWGAPVAHTPAELWYNQLSTPAESFARTLSMPTAVRAFRAASEDTRAAREPRAMPPRMLEDWLDEDGVLRYCDPAAEGAPMRLEEYRLLLAIKFHGRCILTQCVQCFEGMCGADKMGHRAPGFPDDAPMAFDASTRAVDFKAPGSPASWGAQGAFVASLWGVALDGDGTVCCLGDSCNLAVIETPSEMEAPAVDAMDVDSVPPLPRTTQLLFFDDFCLPVSTFPLAVCDEIRDGLHELNDDPFEQGNWGSGHGDGIGWAVGMRVYLSVQIEPRPDATDAWQASAFCIEPCPIIAYPGNSAFDYYNDESCQARGNLHTDVMAACFLWEATNLGKHVGDAHQRWGGA